MPEASTVATATSAQGGPSLLPSPSEAVSAACGVRFWAEVCVSARKVFCGASLSSGHTCFTAADGDQRDRAALDAFNRRDDVRSSAAATAGSDRRASKRHAGGGGALAVR